MDPAHGARMGHPPIAASRRLGHTLRELLARPRLLKQKEPLAAAGRRKQGSARLCLRALLRALLGSSPRLVEASLRIRKCWPSPESRKRLSRSHSRQEHSVGHFTAPLLRPVLCPTSLPEGLKVEVLATSARVVQQRQQDCSLSAASRRGSDLSRKSEPQKERPKKGERVISTVTLHVTVMRSRRRDARRGTQRLAFQADAAPWRHSPG